MADNQTLHKQLGVNKLGVKKGSCLVPLFILIGGIFIFVAIVVRFPQPTLELRTDGTLPLEGIREYIVSQQPDSGKLRFEIFDSQGESRIEIKDEDEILGALPNGDDKNEIVKKLKALKSQLSEYWGQENISQTVQSELLGDVVEVTDVRATGLELFALIFNDYSSVLVNDFWYLARAQLRTIWVLLLCALIPGILGMIYRRAFWTWFLVAFLIMFAINWAISDAGSVGADLKKRLLEPSWTLQFFLFVEVLIILLVLAYSLRRHTGEFSDPKTKRNDLITAVTLIALAVGWIYLMYELQWMNLELGINIEFSGLRLACALVVLFIGLAMLSQALATKIEKTYANQHKNIVVCLDGSWNQPGMLDFGYLAETNVYKLFGMLKTNKTSFRRYYANQCKQYQDKNTERTKQIAFYYHGVGNSVENSQLGQLFGGAFGAGANAIVERAYLDVARVYRPGDRIFIFGFSRGAAIARLLASAIANRDVPAAIWTLRLFGRHWTVWKSSEPRPEVEIEVLGCWDTVGAFGITHNVLGIPFQKINLLKDLTVALSVKRAYHMVALDETRENFAPTLMDPDPINPDRIVEVWFSGSHCNIGGGYATDRLSDLTLDFLLRNISSGYAPPWMELDEDEDNLPQADEDWQPGDERFGIYLSAVRKGSQHDTEKTGGENELPKVIDPEPWGRLRLSTGDVYTFAPRKLPLHAVIHDSVFERMKKVLPVYAPQSLFNLNEELVNKREAIKKEVDHLSTTGSHDVKECDEILDWSNKKLSITKWSKYQDLEVEDPLEPGKKVKLVEMLERPRTSTTHLANKELNRFASALSD